jgi:hypothetical protein
MCCSQCDYYFRCEDLLQQNSLCCGKCEEIGDCRGGDMTRGGMPDEEGLDAFVDEEDGEEFEEEDGELDGDYFDDEDDFDEDDAPPLSH